MHAETDTTLAGRSATWADLPKLALTKRIITETLRLYPPGWIITRAVTADTDLGGHPLTAGDNIVFSAYMMHHRADLFPDAHRFVPDRWLDLDPTSLPRHGYLPFGGGARKCIGETFGLTEAALALATIAARWRLRPISGIRVKPSLRSTLIPGSLPVRLAARTGTAPKGMIGVVDKHRLL